MLKEADVDYGKRSNSKEVRHSADMGLPRLYIGLQILLIIGFRDYAQIWSGLPVFTTLV